MSVPWTTRLQLWNASLEQIEKVITGGGDDTPVAQHVAVVKGVAAQLLTPGPGADTQAVHKVFHRCATVLLRVCKDSNVGANTTVRDGLQLVAWQVVTRGRGSQAVFMALFEALRPDAATPQMQRTALEVLSALAGATDNAQRVVILKGLAETLSLLLETPSAQSEVLLKAYGACSLQFAPPLLPAAPQPLYEAILTPTSALLKHLEQSVRRAGAVATAAIMAYGRPNHIPAAMDEWAARCAALDYADPMHLAEAKGIVICVGETAKVITASNPSASGHILIPLLRFLAGVSPRVLRSFTRGELADVALVTAVLGAFDAMVGLLAHPVVRHEVLDQAGWNQVTHAQLADLLEWLTAWGGKGSESVASCALIHVGHLVGIEPGKRSLADAAVVLSKTVACEDAAVRSSSLVAIGRLAVAFAQLVKGSDDGDDPASPGSPETEMSSSVEGHGGGGSNARRHHHIRALLQIVKDIHAESIVARNDTYAQKSCLSALALVLPVLLRCADARTFELTQQTLFAALHDHAASKEIGCWSGVWTVAYELLDMIGAIPWRFVSDDRLIEAALWWLLTSAEDPDDRVRLKACKVYCHFLTRLPCMYPSEVHPPNRSRSALTDVPTAALASSSACETLLRTPHACDLAGYPPHAGRLMNEQLAAMNISVAVKRTLHALAAEMGMSTSTTPRFIGSLRVLWSLSTTFGYAGADCATLLSPHSELALSALLRVLATVLAQPHIQLKQVAITMECMAGFVAGSAAVLHAGTYRTLLLEVALTWCLVTAAIAHLTEGGDAKVAPETVLAGVVHQFEAVGVAVPQAFMTGKVVKALLDAKAVAYRTTFAAAPTASSEDTVPEGFVGISQVCVALLSTLVEEAADQTLVCSVTDCVLKVVTLHRMHHGRHVLNLLTSLFRTSYGRPDMTRKTAVPMEAKPPLGARVSRRVLKAAANAAPLQTFLNPILESVQLYFKSLDPGVPAAALRLLYTLHCRGVDFSRLDPQRDIAKRLCAIGQKQIEGWAGKADTARAAEHNLPVISGENIVQLLRLLHQAIPCISANLPTPPQLIPVRDVLLRAEQSCTPQLIDSLVPLLIGPFASDTARATFFGALPEAMPCGGYTLALCLQTLKAVGDRHDDYFESVADFLEKWSELEWMGMDVREESLEALADVCTVLARRLSSERCHGVAEALLASDEATSLVAVRVLDAAGRYHSNVVARLEALLSRRARLTWGTLQTYSAVKLLGLLSVDLMGQDELKRMVRCLCRVRSPVESRFLSAISRFLKRALVGHALAPVPRTAATPPPLSHQARTAVVEELLAGLAVILRPWVDAQHPPPVPTSVLLYASVLFDCIAYGLSSTGSRRAWRGLLTTPAAWFCVLLGTFRSGALLGTIASTVQTGVKGGLAHPAVDAALGTALRALWTPPASARVLTRPAWLATRVVITLKMLATAPPVAPSFPAGQRPDPPPEKEVCALDGRVGVQVEAFLKEVEIVAEDGACVTVDGVRAALPAGLAREEAALCRKICGSPTGHLLLAALLGVRAEAAAPGGGARAPPGVSTAAVFRGKSPGITPQAGPGSAAADAGRVVLEDVIGWLGGLLPPTVAVRALEATGGCRAPRELPLLFAAVCACIETQLAAAQQDQAAGARGGLTRSLEAVAVLLRNHLAQVAALPRAAEHLHVLLVAATYVYDTQLSPDTSLQTWEAAASFLSLFAFAHSAEGADIPEDMQEEAIEDAASLTWAGALTPPPAWDASSATPGWSGALMRAVPFRAAWRAFTTRAFHSVLSSYGIGFEYSAAHVLTSAKALGKLVGVVTNVLLNAVEADRFKASVVLGWEALKASPKLAVLTVSNEVVVALEDEPSLPVAVEKLRLVLASFGACPQALAPTITACIVPRLMGLPDRPRGDDGTVPPSGVPVPADAAGTVKWLLGYRLLSLLFTLLGAQPSAHLLVRPDPSHSLSGHPFAMTQLLSVLRLSTPAEVAGGGWSGRNATQHRNLHWPDVLPQPRHLNPKGMHDTLVTVCETFCSATLAVLMKHAKAPVALTMEVVQEAATVLACVMGDKGPGGAGPVGTDMAAQLAAWVDKLPREDDRGVSGRLASLVSSAPEAAGDCRLTSGTMPSHLSGVDPIGLEAACIIHSVLGVHKDLPSVVALVADAHEFTAPAYALCVTLLPRGPLEKCIPKVAERVAERVTAAYDLGYGRGFLFLGAAQMIKKCIETFPNVSEASKLTGRAWEALLTKLTEDQDVGGDGGLPYTNGQLCWVYSVCYALLAHFFVSHSQRQAIGAMASLPAVSLSPSSAAQAAVKSGRANVNGLKVKDVLLLGLMLCSLHPMLSSTPDDDVGHRQSLALVEQLKTPTLRRTAQPVLALLHCLVCQGLHWQQGLPLVLRGYLLTHAVYHKTLPTILPRVLTLYFHEHHLPCGGTFSHTLCTIRRSRPSSRAC
eukprot:TRINITY_DN4021_c0_g1_i2.p1 TRINITY_DN4021_c0_g1~~TRINITY_DN4021_c0_g1_i2.p1  ORF type:complete len:2439 (+),score=716.85 TRINITY_DN4021_c0_g1_i2:45-7319(+)